MSTDERRHVRDGTTLIKVGTRKSGLAKIQTEFVIDQLRKCFGQKYHYEMVEKNTTGDRILDKPLAKIGEKSLFTRELEEALLDNQIDMVVHSLKDLPTTLPAGCCVAAILKREEPNDVLVLKEGTDLVNPIDVIYLNNNSKEQAIGTSSLRRIAQLRWMNSSVQTCDIRGNLHTRLNKLDQCEPFSALILASAGLKRGGFDSRISKRLTVEEDNWFHAVGQGALAVECRTDDNFIIQLLSHIVDAKTTCECLAERSFMKQLEGGCSVPIGVQCSWSAVDVAGGDGHGNGVPKTLHLHGVVLNLEGTDRIEKKKSIRLEATINDLEAQKTDNFTGIIFNFSPESLDSNKIQIERAYVNSARLGHELAIEMLNEGAFEVLNSIRNLNEHLDEK